MTLIFVCLIGLCFAIGAWLLMQSHLVHMLLGIAVLGHGANFLLVVLGVGGSATPAFITEGADTIAGSHADPLPQALVLTAIVIGFGVLAFALALAARAWQETGTDIIDDLHHADRLGSKPSTNKKSDDETSGEVA